MPRCPGLDSSGGHTFRFPVSFKVCSCCFFVIKNGVNLGSISNFLGKSCCSEIIVTDFYDNNALRWTGIPTQEIWETGAPLTITGKLWLLYKVINYTLNSSGIPTQQMRETGAPWTTANKYTLSIYKLGFKPSKRGRQELPWLIFQSMIVKF